MTDEQYRDLRTLILEQNLKIAELSLTIRALQRRVEELAAADQTVYTTAELTDLLKTRQSRGPHTDT